MQLTPDYLYFASTAGGENDDVEVSIFGEEVKYEIPPEPAERRDLVKNFEVFYLYRSTKIAYHTIPTATIH